MRITNPLLLVIVSIVVLSIAGGISGAAGADTVAPSAETIETAPELGPPATPLLQETTTDSTGSVGTDALSTDTIDRCGVTINSSGRYTVTSDISNSNNLTCIEIAANDVIVDGAGATIDGTTSDGSTGVLLTQGVTNVTVQNLTIQEWEQNILASGVSAVTFRNLTLADADTGKFGTFADGLAVYQSNTVTIADVSAVNNGGRGVYVVESTNVSVVRANLTDSRRSQLRFQSVSDSVVRDSVGANSGIEAGFLINDSDNVTIKDSLATGNKDYNSGEGFLLKATDNSVLRNVTARSNSIGIRLSRYYGTDDASTSNRILNSTVHKNSDTGIDIYDSPYNSIRNSSIRNNSAGVEIRSYQTTIHDVTLADNVIRHNFGGVLISGNYRARYDEKTNTVFGNDLWRNDIADNENYGVWLLASRGTTMRENALSGSEQNFIVGEYQIDDPSHTLEYYSHDIDTSNTVDGQPVYYKQGVTDWTLDEQANAGFVAVVNGTNVTIEDQRLSNNSHGVLAVGSQDLTVRNVTVEHSQYGVAFIETVDSAINESTFRDMNDDEWAVTLADSSNRNQLYRNTLTQDVTGSTGIYIWNGSSQTQVVNNTIKIGPSQRGSYSTAVRVRSGADGTQIDSNTVVGASIDVSGGYPIPQATRITDNIIRDSAAEASIDDSANATYIIGNRIDNTTGYSSSTTALSAGKHSTVRDNVVTGSSGDGIGATSFATVENNTVRNASENGVQLTGDSVRLTNSNVVDSLFGIQIGGDNHYVAHNTIINSSHPQFDAAGIYDYGYARDSVIEQNTIQESDAGLWLTGDGDDGNVSSNSVFDSAVAIRVDGNGALNYSVNDTTVRNTSSWDYYESGVYYGDQAGTTVTNLSVAPASLSFTNRHAAVATMSQPVCDPVGQRNLGTFLNTTSTTSTAWLNITVPYDEQALNGAAESSVTLLRYNGTAWTPVGATQDTQANTLHANITTFGPLGVFANGTATCPTGLIALSETTTVLDAQVSPALVDRLRVQSTVAPELGVTLLTNTSTEYSLAINASASAKNVTLYLSEPTLTTALGNLSNVNLTLDAKALPYYRQTGNGTQWVGFEIDHFSTRTVTFRNESASTAEPLNVTAFQATTANASVRTQINTTGAPSTLTVNMSRNGSVVRTLSLAQFTQQTVDQRNYTFTNTSTLSGGDYTLTLNATGTGGTTVTDTTTVTVAAAPTVNVTLLQSVHNVGSPMRINVSATATNQTIDRVQSNASHVSQTLANSTTCAQNVSTCVTVVTLTPTNSTWNGSAYTTLAIDVTATSNVSRQATRQVSAQIYIGGDANGDGEVNIFDASRVGQSWRAAAGETRYSDGADLNNDGVVNLFDIVIIGSHWQTTASG